AAGAPSQYRVAAICRSGEGRGRDPAYGRYSPVCPGPVACGTVRFLNHGHGRNGVPVRRSHLVYRWLATVLLLCSAWPVAAGLTGNPPVTRFVPTLDVFPQNFAIAQDRDAIVYIGNSEGVLTFDGERWRL